MFCVDDKCCDKKDVFQLWQGEEPSALQAKPFLVALKRTPALEAELLHDCHLSAALPFAGPDPKVALGCREITAATALPAGYRRYHCCWIFYFR